MSARYSSRWDSRNATDSQRGASAGDADPDPSSDEDSPDEDYRVEDAEASEDDDHESSDSDDREMSGAEQLFQPLGPPGPPLQGELATELLAAASLANPRWPASDGAAKPLDLLRQRDTGTSGQQGGLSRAQRRHVMSQRPMLPTAPQRVVDHMDSRAYIGQFSQDGSLFVAAFQSTRRLRLYSVEGGWRRVKDVFARGLRWTVTDTAISPDQRLLLYSTISDRVSLVNLAIGQDVYSEANVTDIHEELNFSVAAEGDSGMYARRQFGIWSIRWSSDGNHIVAGTNNDSLCVYDVQCGKTRMEVEVHQDDVNAVAYAQPGDDNILFTGSDDRLVKVWDLRQLDAEHNKPVGVLVGHTEGVTHLDSRGDGRYLISNGKDQTVKLWDVRMALSHRQAAACLQRVRVPTFRWDYRWQHYPGRGRDVRHPGDVSIQTYRGHHVLQTLSRAYFSPHTSTGSRFIYAGSADGSIKMWDVVSAQVVCSLRYHQEVVRDCHWHPWLPLLVSTSFDGHVVQWGLPGSCQGPRLPAPGCDQLQDW